MMNGALLLQIFSAVGGLAGFSAIINLLISRKKISAESEDILQNTTDKVIKNLTNDNEDLREEITGVKQELSNIREENRKLYQLISVEQTALLEANTALNKIVLWSRMSYDIILELGGTIEPPPSYENIMRILNTK